YNNARRSAAAYYDEAFAAIEDIVTPFRAPYSSHVFHQYTLRAPRRNELQQYLQQQEVPSMIYYPVPLHLQEAYASYGYKKGDCPVSEKLAEEVISLPMHSELDKDQLAFITELVTKFYKNGE